MHNKKKCGCPDCEEFIEPDSPCTYLCIMCDTNGCTREKGQTPRPTEKEYRAAAKRIWHKDGDIEIDSNATVSFSEDGGAYVQAWVWIDEDETEPLPEKKGRMMFILTITLLSTIGIQHPVTLNGINTPPYPTLEACQRAAQEVSNWLTQDHIKVTYTCSQQ